MMNDMWITDGNLCWHLTDVYLGRRACRQNWLHDRPVSIPPYLRPIEEESDNEDQPNSLSVDCCENSADCRTMTSSTGARDVITSRPMSESLQRDVCRRPVSDRVANDVITTDQYRCDEGDTYRTGENDVTRNDVILESPSRDAHQPPDNKGGTPGTPNDVRGESQSNQHWRLDYVIVASLVAFVACLTSMSPSCVIFIVTVTSLIAHHAIQS